MGANVGIEPRAISGVAGHYFLIKAYECAEAIALQPFAYLHMMFGAAIGVIFFKERLEPSLMVGSVLIILAGIAKIRVEQRRGRHN